MKNKGMRMNTLLLLSIIGTVLLVLMSAMLLFFQTYRRALVRNAETAGQRSIAQVSKTVNDYLADINTVMNTLYAELEADELSREEFFDAFLRIRPDVIAVSTYTDTRNLVRCYSIGHTPMNTEEPNLSFDRQRLKSEPDGYISAPHVVNLFAGYYPWSITMVSPAKAGLAEKWVALDISCSNISDYINDVGIGRRGYCFLLDTDGNIVYHPQQQLLYSDLKTENMELISSLDDGSHMDGRVIYTLQTLDNDRWRVVGVSFVEDVIQESLGELARILLVAAVLILAATFLISALLSRELSRPIQGLARAMEQFEQDADNFSYEPAGGTREVRDLSNSFRHMVLRIQQLMGTVRQEEVNLRKTELRALQSQINPHFLYNTLDSISWMCEQGKNAEAVQMVNALARLFRISISRGHELIPIRNELQHAESYLQIQAHRYKNQFVYCFDADEDCMDYLCNKITLQPILENAIYHGLNGLVDDGSIEVTVRGDGDDVVFTVKDNGSGMSPEQISAIMSKEHSDKSGIGIKNVDDRLKIYFGSAYGISIDSTPDVGTTVYIRMPKIREEAKYENR